MNSIYNQTQHDSLEVPNNIYFHRDSLSKPNAAFSSRKYSVGFLRNLSVTIRGNHKSCYSAYISRTTSEPIWPWYNSAKSNLSVFFWISTMLMNSRKLKNSKSLFLQTCSIINCFCAVKIDVFICFLLVVHWIGRKKC